MRKRRNQIAYAAVILASLVCILVPIGRARALSLEKAALASVEAHQGS